MAADAATIFLQYTYEMHGLVNIIETIGMIGMVGMIGMIGMVDTVSIGKHHDVHATASLH